MLDSQSAMKPIKPSLICSILYNIPLSQERADIDGKEIHLLVKRAIYEKNIRLALPLPGNDLIACNGERCPLNHHQDHHHHNDHLHLHHCHNHNHPNHQPHYMRWRENCSKNINSPTFESQPQ